jgi:NTE family protein
VLVGMMEVLKRKPEQPALFRVMSGTSVGAINAAYLAANAEAGDHNVARLVRLWTSLRFEQHMKLRMLGLMRWPRRVAEMFAKKPTTEAPGTSLLDARELEKLVAEAIDFGKLRENVRSGKAQALLLAALHVVSGRTTVFAEIAPNSTFAPSPSGMRVNHVAPITIDHVLASAAIPLLFPTRKVGERFYCDGGLRFNTPIAPALRAGADPLVVISVSHRATEEEIRARADELDAAEGRDLGPMFLVGKILNALLLDPVKYDLQVLARLNQLVDVLEESLAPEELAQVQDVLVRTRGVAYRRVETLVFEPSLDIGRLAGDYLRTDFGKRELNPVIDRFLVRASREGMSQEADWAAYLLFDGGFAQRLIELGRSDAWGRASEIRSVLG